MNGRSMFWKRFFILQSALVLGACGGGGGSDPSKCVSAIAGLCASLGAGGSTTQPGDRGQTGTALSLFPAAVNAGDCTTNIPFVFTGGTAPFTVLTSDNFGVPVSTALPLGSDSYFTASIRNPLGPFPYISTVTVLDSQSRTAVSKITTDFPRACPSNALLQTQPASANSRVTEIQTFQITGSQAPFTVTSTDTSIVTVPVGNLPASTLNAQATPSNRTTQATALITVRGADGQQANIVFTVLPAP